MRQLKRAEVAEILGRYLQGKATPVEEENVRRWFDELGSDVRLYVDADAKDAIKTRILDKIAQQSAIKGLSGEYAVPEDDLTSSVAPLSATGILSLYWKLAAAVLLLMAIGISAWLMNLDRSDNVADEYASAKFSQVTNDGTSVKDVLLDDGSTVKLQPHSTLSYTDVTKGPTRILKLEGEAYFEVAHDKKRPFIVHAGGTRTRVVGTSFTIKAPGQSMSVSVTVRTGIVAVSKDLVAKDDRNDTSEVVLTPNQKVIYDPSLNKLSTSLVELPVLLPEHLNDEAMQFDDASVAFVLQKLESSYGVHIDFDKQALAHCRISIKFTTEGLYERLKIVSKAIGASYERNGTQIKFTTIGC